jgi:hypothetical protein
MAGLLATLLMGMGLNVLLYLCAIVGVAPPEESLRRFFEQGATHYAGGNGVRFAVLVVTIVFASELSWAVVYSHLPPAVLRIAPWLRGLAFSILPLSFSTLVLLPTLGAGPLGLHLEAGLVPLAGEVLRNVLYAVGLAMSYSLLRVARQRPARAALDDRSGAATAAGEGPSDLPDSPANSETCEKEPVASLGD